MPMSLAILIWTPISYHAMVAAFLQAERHRFTKQRYIKSGEEALYSRDMAVIDLPDLDNPDDNHRRLRLLNLIRAPLLGEIPPDTIWYKVAHVGDAHLAQLYFIARCGWEEAAGNDGNILDAAPIIQAKEPRILKTPPAAWAPPIVWGHTKDGPLTIMEGNNRLMAYVVSEAKPLLDITMIAGLSPTPCYRHRFDPPHMLVDDLFGLPQETERPRF